MTADLFTPAPEDWREVLDDAELILGEVRGDDDAAGDDLYEREPDR